MLSVGLTSVRQAHPDQESRRKAVHLWEPHPGLDTEPHLGVFPNTKHCVRNSWVAPSRRCTPPVFDDEYSDCMGTLGYTANPLARVFYS